MARLLPLAWLAPDIVEAILDGHQSKHLTVQRLMAKLPIDWVEQRKYSALKSSPRGTDDSKSRLLLGRRRESGIQGRFRGEMDPLHVNLQGLGAAPCVALL